MHQRARVGGQRCELADQADRLGRKHRQHLMLEADVAERHAPEMIEIDRTVIGSEWRRWHPVNPSCMKRHGDNPLRAWPVRQRGFGKPITKRVNGTFDLFAASSPCFWRRVAPIGGREREFCEPVRPYGPVLLTMIKIVLIAGISFAPPSQ